MNEEYIKFFSGKVLEADWDYYRIKESGNGFKLEGDLLPAKWCSYDEMASTLLRYRRLNEEMYKEFLDTFPEDFI